MCKVKKMRANMELKLKIRAVLQLSLNKLVKLDSREPMVFSILL